MKVVINKRFGGFGLSSRVYQECQNLGFNIDFKEEYYDGPNKLRSNPILVRVVEQLGEEANGPYAKLRVADIPFDGPDGWYIDNYDGIEQIHEIHRIWG